ncbi:MAG TPA: putative Ig domain-containing protein, partial [Paraburkholderia sp.]|nr:putative Ig domain-containing protein [Paraburkholderia sp.]
TLTSAGATATNAQWSRALSEITFATSSSSVGPRTVLFVVSDGAKTSATVSATVQVLATVSAPPPALPAANTSNSPPPNDLPHYPGAASRAPEAPILLSSRTLERFDGIVVNNTPNVLAEFEPERPVGEIPQPYTYTFTTDDRPFLVGRTSVPPLPPLVPDSLRTTDAGVDTLPPLTLDVAAANGRFAIDLARVDGVSFANAARVDVMLANGRPLPGWLHFDAAAGKLSGTLPRGAHDVRVMVQATDANGHTVRREIVVAPAHHRGRHAPAAHTPRGGHAPRGSHAALGDASAMDARVASGADTDTDVRGRSAFAAHAAFEPRAAFDTPATFDAHVAFDPHAVPDPRSALDSHSVSDPHSMLDPHSVPPHDTHAAVPAPARPLAGKPSLAAQFAQASAALHVARPAGAAMLAHDAAAADAARAAQGAGADPSVTHG